MAKQNFTVERVAAFKCELGKQQSIFWDGKVPGLGLRVTANGARAYIFESRLNGKTLRITIGDPRTWTIAMAQAEAIKHKVLTDQGIDPRKQRAEKLAAEVAAAEAAAETSLRESITLETVWAEYVIERSPCWGAHHIAAHTKIIQQGGLARKRSSKLTKPGPLADLRNLRLVELTNERIEAWARQEAKLRPSSARLAIRLLKACLNWCAEHANYGSIIGSNPATSTKVRETLGKPKVKEDVLQKEQLAPWFTEVKKIGNPVISAYLQTLLLIGARREELASLRWEDVSFQWKTMRLKDKIEAVRQVPLTPYVAHLLAALPRRNEWVFSSPGAESGKLAEPRYAHNQALKAAGLPELTLHGLRRSFATLSEWVETPAGIAAQIQGHAPQGVREQNYIRRPIDLLRMWHCKIEDWILAEAGVHFVSAAGSLKLVGS